MTTRNPRFVLHPVTHAVLLLLLLSGTAAAQSLPTGGSISVGNGRISQSGQTLTVDQGSPKLSINWNSFNIGAGQTVNFNQPGTSAIALNRVLGTDGSKIFGQLNANGQVFLINPNGVLFGRGAQVNVGGLVASTLGLSDQDFLAGRYRFSGSGTPGAVLNQGNLHAADGGYIAMLGAQVDNEGLIQARLGSVALGAGQGITLNFAGDRLLNLQIDQGVAGALAQNGQLIQADGGSVWLTAKATDALLDTVVNNQGIIEARTLENHNGTITLLGNMDQGTVKVGGTLDASAPNGGNGGFIETSGHIVQVGDTARITTKAASGKTGQWLIDPTDYYIGNDPGNGSSFMTGATLSANLANTNMTIATLPGGSAPGDIYVNQAVNWNSGFSLDLEAYRNINVNANITNAGAGNIILRSDKTGTGIGTVIFNTGNTVGTAGSISLYYNPSSYTAPTVYTGNISAGTLSAYMLVNNVTQLQAITNNLAGIYALSQNIDASATSTWNSGAGFVPIGGGSYFTGTLDGQGHVISNLFINLPSTNYVGLFGKIGGSANTGIISNLGIVNANITGYRFTGILAGYTSYGSVTNTYVTGALNSGDDYVGGLVGQSENGVFANVYSTASVSAPDTSGSGSDEIGGLIGAISNGSITNSYATGAVNGGDDYVGGLVGDARTSTITRSYATGSVQGATGSQATQYMGGLVGYSTANISDSYATGYVTGGYDSVGGFIGWNDGGTVTNSFSTGLVRSPATNVAGFIGFNKGGVTNSYWDTTTSGQSLGANSVATGITGQTTAQLQGGLPSGFNPAVWGIEPGISYGYLNWRFPTGPTIVSGMANTGGDNSALGVKLAGGGNLLENATTGANGYYYFTVDPRQGPVLTWLSGGAAVGNALTNIDAVGGNATGLNIVANTVTVYSSDVATLSGIMAPPLGGLTAPGVLYTVDGSSLTLTPNINLNFTATTDLTIDRNITTTGTGTVLVKGSGALTLGAGTTVSSQASGNAVVLSAQTVFNNQSGAGAVSTGNGRWLIYSANPANDNFNNLNSANVAVWSSTYASQPPGGVTQTGNRYLFSVQPTLTFTSSNLGKVYGNTGNVGSTYTVSGGFAETGVAGAYLGENPLNAFSGAPTLGSAGTLSSANVGGYQINIAQGTVSALNGYALVFLSSGQLTVTPRPITLTGDQLSKIYGNTDPNLTYQITSGNLVGTDTLSGASARLAGQNVGNYATNQGTLANSNYAITFVNGNLQITPRPITLTGDRLSKIYGNTDPNLTYQITGGNLVGTDTLSGAAVRQVGENVGNYAINQGTLANSNYAITFVNGQLQITPRPITLTGDQLSKIYGNTDPNLTYQITGGNLVGTDTLSGTVTRQTGENVGNYAINQGTVANSNYAITFVNGQLQITPRPITLTGDQLSKIYGNTDPNLTYQITSGNLVGTDTLSGAAGRQAGENVGNYATGQGTIANSNYAITFVNGQLQITPRPITLTGDQLSKIYGNTDPNLTYHVTSGNLVGTDTLSGVAVRQAGENVGNYLVSQGTLANSNYAITFVNGGLQITPRPITLTGDQLSKVYGNTDPNLTYQVTTGNLVGADTLSGTVTRQAGENVGNYLVSQGTLANSNYAITFVNGQLQITPRPITLTGDQLSKVYGNTDPNLTYQITGGNLVGTDALSGAVTRQAGENVGNYLVTQGTLANSNYAITFVNGGLQITPRPITLTGDQLSKVYGNTDPNLTYQVTGGNLVGSDTLSGAATRQAGENVGNYAIAQGTLANSNYTITFVNGELQITPRPITLTGDQLSKVYGNTDPNLTYQITSGNLVGTDAISGAATRQTGENVGNYAINQGTLANSNYAITFVNGQLQITPRPITLTGDQLSKIYGKTDPNLTYQIAAGNLVGTDTLSGAATRQAGENVGGYAINQGTLANGNYAITFVNGQLQITPRPITLTGDQLSKIYGNTDPNLTYQITSGNLVGSDTLSGATTRQTGENVGNYAINQGTLANSNYAITFVNGQLQITPRPITLTGDQLSKIYGNTDPNLTYQITGGNLVGADTLSGATTRQVGENVGSYLVTQGTLANSNYAITFVNGGLQITPRPITLTGDQLSKIYGNTDPNLTYQITTGNLVGTDTLSGATTRQIGENVGNYLITQGTLANSNYAITFVNGGLQITPRPITLTGDQLSKIYGNTDSNLTYQITTGNLVGTDTLSGTTTRQTGENVGNYAIEQGTLANSNYAITFVNGQLQITPRAITLTGDQLSKIYGNTDPNLAYQVTSGNLVGTDTLSGAATRQTGENVGSYAITQGTLANSNYTITFVNGQLQITPRPITLTGDQLSKIYGNTDPNLTYQITSGNLVGTDTLSGATTRQAGENVGGYAISQGTLANSNYTITFVNGQLQITPRPITLTGDQLSKIYGNTDPNLTYQITGGNLVGTDSLSGAITRQAGENVGNYAIGQGTLANSNYAITFVNGQLQITPRPITLTGDQLSKIYGNTDPNLTYQITGGNLVGTDTLSGATTRQTGENVGNYAIEQGTLANSNYAITFVNGQLQITPRAITLTGDQLSKIYGNTDPNLAYLVTSGNLVGNDTLSGAATRQAGENVGNYTIGQGTLANSNYTITFVNGQLQITQRPITLTGDQLSKIYGNTDPNLAYQVTSGNLVGNDTLSGAATRQAGENVGSYAISQGTLANSNYTITFVNGQLQITPRPITLTGDQLGKIYGNTDPNFTYQITNGNLVGGDTLGGAATRQAGENVGGYAIDQGTLANSNYAITFVNGQLQITPRPITLTGDQLGKIYGNTDPNFTYQITNGNLIGTDTLSGTATRQAGENVSGYAIEQGTLANSNYAITFVNGQLQITPRPITLTGDQLSKIYGNTDPNFAYQITGGNLVGNDSLSGAATRQTGENVGNYAIGQGTLANSNYAITFVNGQLQITPATLTVRADNVTGYWGFLAPYSVTVSGLRYDDTATGVLGGKLTFSTNVGTPLPGEYVITPSGYSALSPNYVLNYAAGTLQLLPANPQVPGQPDNGYHGSIASLGGLLGHGGGSGFGGGALGQGSSSGVGGGVVGQGNAFGPNSFSNNAVAQSTDHEGKAHGEKEPQDASGGDRYIRLINGGVRLPAGLMPL
ncbi:MULTISPECIES: MBG domain-containing protein [Paraburkholderia]|uniref:MBG domain-containing protein n=1 Tax=Paraburkholderia TaxID=1822464 RepID=UPI00224E14F7|nr:MULTISPECIES: MBG domain-containing protein [Paraburkholderia]MCX4160047.1 MBG domain-containing protein [Paraburkholderia megapolitana]MDN7155547.1 filamentous hemagglutinin N-terminal domain-containing protein [Paraburkholderia sp. CHISQ3]MDQ6492591.1 filamentous hemagglutinin N-terminal domain-containing protein [Paraburkholderia megapolitana]